MSQPGDSGPGGPSALNVAECARRAYFGMTDRDPQARPQVLAYLWVALQIMAGADGGFVNECALRMDAGALRLTLAQSCIELERLGKPWPITGDDAASIYVAAMDMVGPEARSALIEAIAGLTAAGWEPEWPEDGAAEEGDE
jgi:hypothetical protein